MGTLNTVAALLRSLMFISCFTAQISLAQTVTVSSATIQGTTTSIAAASAVVSQYLGVPFAVSPPQRFSPATPNNLQGRYAAKTYKPACIQAFPCEWDALALELMYTNDRQTPLPWSDSTFRKSSTRQSHKRVKTACTSTSSFHLARRRTVGFLSCSGYTAAATSSAMLANRRTMGTIWQRTKT